MKATGILRRKDKLGIDIKYLVEICVEQEIIVLTRYEQVCIFCGGAAEEEYRRKHVCRERASANCKRRMIE